MGPAGPGYAFTATTGNPGPTLSAGTYWGDVEARLGPYSTATTLLCSVAANGANNALLPVGEFAAAGFVPAGTEISQSLASVLALPQSGQLQLTCSTGSGTSTSPVGVPSVTWYVSPIAVTTASAAGTVRR